MCGSALGLPTTSTICRAELTRARLNEAMGMLDSIGMLAAAKEPIDGQLLERIKSSRSSFEDDINKLDSL